MKTFFHKVQHASIHKNENLGAHRLFVRNITTAWVEAMKKVTTIINAWRACGLVPFNPDHFLPNQGPSCGPSLIKEVQRASLLPAPPPDPFDPASDSNDDDDPVDPPSASDENDDSDSPVRLSDAEWSPVWYVSQ